jgi:transposase InsO family protein
MSCFATSHSWKWSLPPSIAASHGLIERFMRTLKEECIYVHRFRTLEEARFVIGRFIQRDNSEWLLQRHGYKTPAEVRQQLTRKAA